MVSINIIADDLTGAGDSGLQFHNSGLRVLVLRNPELVEDYASEYDVISLDIDSRNRSHAEAVERTKDGATVLNFLRPSALTYKKIDSTLRGHVGEEMNTLMNVLSLPFALVAPAYPVQGRQTINGTHLVNSVPLAQTHLSHDPHWPRSESNLQRLLESQLKRRIVHLDQDKMNRGFESLGIEVENALEDGAEIITFDVVSDADLNLIAQIGLDMERHPLFVGSAGLAARLGEGLGIDREIRVAAENKTTSVEGGSVAFVGSLSEVSDLQVKEAVKAGARLIRLDENMIGSDTIFSASLETLTNQISSNLSQGIDSLIWTKPDGEGPITPSPYNPFTRLLIRLASRVVLESKLTGFILNGGDTASIILSSLEAQALEITAEIQPSVPSCSVVVGKNLGLRVITKAGAFGDENTLVGCFDFLRRDSK